MNTFYLSLGIAFVSFLFQVRPRFRNRYFGVDTWRHLAAADYIRKFKRLPGILKDKYLINEPADYPPFLRIILACLSKKFLTQFQWIVSPFFDFFHSLLVFWIAFTISGNLTLAVVAQLVYSFNPLVVMENSNLTTRSLASLLFTPTFYFLICYSLGLGRVYLVLAVILATVLFLTHRMAIQALLILCFTFTCLHKDILYMGVFCSSMILAIILSGGFYLKILKGHLAMLQFWKRNIHHRYAHQIKGLLPKDQENPDMVFRIYQYIKKVPFVAVLAGNPFVVVSVLGVFLLRSKLDNYAGFSSQMISSLYLWGLTLLVFGILVRQLKFIEFMGEGERYLEYAGLPIALLSGIIFAYGMHTPFRPFYLWGFVSLFLFVDVLPALFLQQKVIVGDTERSVTPDLEKIFEYIDSIKGEVRLMTFPLALADMAMYFTKSKVLSTDSGWAHLKYYSDFFPVLKKSLKEIFETYRINYILINERYISLADLKLGNENPEYKAGIYSLVKIEYTNE